MIIEEATQVTDELVEAFVRLTPQLSASNPAPTRAQLAEMVGSPAITLLVVREPDAAGEIVGSLTLALFRVPTGCRAWIEDVVVDPAQRGKGIGEALTREALRVAQEAGAITVDLTSRPIARGGQSALSAHRIREARDKCLSLHADRTVSPYHSPVTHLHLPCGQPQGASVKSPGDETLVDVRRSDLHSADSRSV